MFYCRAPGWFRGLSWKTDWNLVDSFIDGVAFFQDLTTLKLTYRLTAKGRDGEETTTHARYKICTIIQPIKLQTPIEHHFYLTKWMDFGGFQVTYRDGKRILCKHPALTNESFKSTIKISTERFDTYFWSYVNSIVRRNICQRTGARASQKHRKKHTISYHINKLE